MISEGHIIVGQKDKEFPSIQSVNDLQHFGKTAFTKTDLKNKKINYTPTTVKHVAATNLSFLYLPQTMGILLVVWTYHEFAVLRNYCGKRSENCTKMEICSFLYGKFTYVDSASSFF